MTDVQRGTKIFKIIADTTSQNYSADLVPLYQNFLQNNISGSGYKIFNSSRAVEFLIMLTFCSI